MEKEIRLEDFGKMVLKNAEPLDQSIIADKIHEFVTDMRGDMTTIKKDVKYLLLLSKEVGYYSVLKIQDRPGLEEKIMVYLFESSFLKDGEICDLKNIQFIEYNKETFTLEFWVDQVYFCLFDFDWGVATL